jgi:alpha-beta hydrolase superfamily lysophospholipase
MKSPLLAGLVALLCSACAGNATAPQLSSAALARSPAPSPANCPKGVPADARCLTGRDSAGASYWIAMPAQWNGTLVLHAHGGPELGEPKAERSAEDLTRWAIMVRAGYAWAGSTYRQGGVAVRSAAEDTERLRQVFVTHVARPRHTTLHGQSWGASVAAKGAEMFATANDGRSPYDALLLTSGVLGGGTRSYDFRLDLRVVYQAVCGNHPRPDEAQYPLWQGLPPAATLTRAQLAQRVDECTGIRSRPEARSAAQQRNLATLLNTVRIPEGSLLGHLNWGTWHFQDIVFKRLDGHNPFGNIGAQYRGSPDDAALDARVARYAAEPAAVARFAQDSDLGGRIPVPVLSAHAVDDPVAFVELESEFLETMRRAGTADRLVQVFTDESEHSYLDDTEYPALMEALLAWIERGEKPSPQTVAARCAALEPTYGARCRILPDYRPDPLDSRVTPRQR